MAKKKGKIRKFITLSFVGMFVCVVFLLQHYGIIAFSGSGGLGWGTNSMHDGGQLAFYFSDDTIFYGKEKITKEQFNEIVNDAKKKKQNIALYFVEERITNGFEVSIHEIVSRAEVVTSKSKIKAEQMPK